MSCWCEFAVWAAWLLSSCAADQGKGTLVAPRQVQRDSVVSYEKTLLVLLVFFYNNSWNIQRVVHIVCKQSFSVWNCSRPTKIFHVLCVYRLPAGWCLLQLALSDLRSGVILLSPNSKTYNDKTYVSIKAAFPVNMREKYRYRIMLVLIQWDQVLIRFDFDSPRFKIWKHTESEWFKFMNCLN